ncbi:MAG: FixH family protein [candidate division KSB1 bacterium]|nr:FixH family protein [candidate division KSB1 bacterium]
MGKKRKIHIWPLAIGIIYGLFMIYLIGLFAFSRMHRPELVSQSYYEDELKYQQQINRMNRTQSEAASPTLQFQDTDRTLTLEFPAAFASGNTRGQIVFFRPSDASQDVQVPLTLDVSGRQVVDIGKLSKGLWKVKIHWRKDGKEYYHEEVVILP